MVDVCFCLVRTSFWRSVRFWDSSLSWFTSGDDSTGTNCSCELSWRRREVGVLRALERTLLGVPSRRFLSERVSLAATAGEDRVDLALEDGMLLRRERDEARLISLGASWDSTKDRP
jgi:hypothetical protein